MRAALLAVLAACGGGAVQTKAPKAQAIDDAKAEKGAQDLLAEIYEDISHADTDSLQPSLSPQLVVFGPRKADVFGNRGDAVAALKTFVDPKAKQKAALRSGGLVVVPASGGHSAWAMDVVDVAGMPLALTAILTNADDIWLVNVVALAQVPSSKKLHAQLKQDAVVPAGLTGPAKIDGAAQAAVDKFKAGLAAQSARGDELASRSDAAYLGPTSGEIARGKAEIKKLWKKRGKTNVREALAGDVTAGTTADGQLAWVTAPVVRFADEEDPLPLRDFAVFEKNGGWKLIALQEAAALDEAGAGATFKKTPAPPVQKPAEPAKKPAEAEKPKTKPKKKKRPKPADSDDSG